MLTDGESDELSESDSDVTQMGFQTAIQTVIPKPMVIGTVNSLTDSDGLSLMDGESDGETDTLSLGLFSL